MRNLAVIPARSGSKGLKDKNIKLLEGKPLIAYSIDAAIGSCLFSTVHVSTDSDHYADVARQFGADVPFLRSAETSTDSASSWEAVLEVLQEYEKRGQFYDTVMLLQPTSPLRTKEDIRRGYQILGENHADTVVSVCEVDHSPLWCNTLPVSGCMNGFIRPEASASRQQLKTYFRINGAIYLISVKKLQEKKALLYDASCYAYVMPKKQSIDIDDEYDFMLAEFLLRSI